MRKKIDGFDCVWLNKSGEFFYNVPTRKKRPSGGGYIRRFIRLKAEDLLEVVKEIEKRKLYDKFFHLSKEERRKKLRSLKKSARTYKFHKENADKLSDVVDFFSWKGFENFKLKINYLIPDLKFDNGTFTFNPKWVNQSSERVMILKVRGFVIERTR
ncbi:hypothetical protein CMI37_28455 [Candidatus Pacearchaeota archaeon]|nr:hypothetical protein [Candidatus Pacearchaeota archaeon]